MELEFLKSLVLIFGVSAIVVFALGRLRIPSIVGFLIAGVILGPHGFQFIKDVHEVELFAEIVDKLNIINEGERIGFGPDKDCFRCHIDPSGVAISPIGGRLMRRTKE
jgi:NhaP-type Na+/H+ and K+/H+ antiporter